jgi:hypothetical protein
LAAASSVRSPLESRGRQRRWPQIVQGVGVRDATAGGAYSFAPHAQQIQFRDPRVQSVVYVDICCHATLKLATCKVRKAV